jgi:adenylosuccinate lyase
MGLKPASVSTQVIQRDVHAEFMSALALLAAGLEKTAVEIRHLQRTEVLEAEEYFAKGQKGSSAMPHKRNPIITERVTGMARIVRGNLVAALENVALWHERDISHSSVERVIVPDSCIAVDYMLSKMIPLIENLLIYPDRMMRNLNLTRGLVFSQKVLLKLTEKGMTREDAYRIVQRSAMDVWKDEQKELKSELQNDEEVMGFLSQEELDGIFDLSNSLKHVDYIFQRSIYKQ